VAALTSSIHFHRKGRHRLANCILLPPMQLQHSLYSLTKNAYFQFSLAFSLTSCLWSPIFSNLVCFRSATTRRICFC
jgi:hypothetical protein